MPLISRKPLAGVPLIELTPRVEGDGHLLPLVFWESKIIIIIINVPLPTNHSTPKNVDAFTLRDVLTFIFPPTPPPGKAMDFALKRVWVITLKWRATSSDRITWKITGRTGSTTWLILDVSTSSLDGDGWLIMHTQYITYFMRCINSFIYNTIKKIENKWIVATVWCRIARGNVSKLNTEPSVRRWVLRVCAQILLAR